MVSDEDSNENIPLPPKIKKGKKHGRSEHVRVVKARKSKKVKEEVVKPSLDLKAMAVDVLLPGVRKAVEKIATRKRGAIDKDVKFYAAIADTAYVRNTEHRRNRILNLEGGSDWEMIRGDKYHSSYLNEKENKVITTFRGTDPKDVNDLHADLHIAVGGEEFTKRFKHARARMLDLLKMYPANDGYTHVLVGHSLGGTINNHIMDRFGDQISEVHNFNPGSGAASVLRGIRGKKACAEGLTEEDCEKQVKKVHNHYVIGDPVSMVGAKYDDGTNRHVYAPLVGSSNPHSLQQFMQ